MVENKKIRSNNNKRRDLLSLLVLCVIILLLNFIGAFYFKRFDLTSEKRYTLAPSTRKLLKELDDQVYLKVYLNGDFNPGFTRLRKTRRLPAGGGKIAITEAAPPALAQNKQLSMLCEVREQLALFRIERRLL